MLLAGSHTDWLRQLRNAQPWAQAYRVRAFCLDVSGGAIAVAVAQCASFGFAVPAVYRWVSLTLILTWPFALFMAGAYEAGRLGVPDDEYRAVISAFTGFLSFYAAAALAVKATVSSSFLLLSIGLLLLLGLTSRLTLRNWLRRRRASGKLTQRTVVVGRGDSAAALINSVRGDIAQGLVPVAACVSDVWPSTDEQTHLLGIPVLGSPADTLTAVMKTNAEVVAIAATPDLSAEALRRITWALAERNVELIVAPGLFDVAGPRFHLRPSANLALLHVEPPSPSVTTRVLKGVGDRFMAAMLLLCFVPLLVTIALAIKLSSKGPIFFRQTRIGVHGEPFVIYKFRTMHVDAHLRLDEIRALSEGNLVQFKMRTDPRVTRIGRILRRYSIDELPQLMNVLLGNMSIVGPRPQSREEVDQYELDAVRRLRVRPGMTGLWQVSGRSDLNWRESVKLDLRYVDNISLTLDLRILFSTVGAVIRGGGAY